MDDKQCKRCGEVKPYADFWFNGTAANGGNICKDCKRLRDAAHREANRDAYRESRRRWSANNPDREREARKRYARQLRDAIRAAYGPDCQCCGESEDAFLTLDHIEGGGSAHRKELNGKVHQHLRREGFPPGYRILCWNCNWAYRLAGTCPHQQEPGRKLHLA